MSSAQQQRVSRIGSNQSSRMLRSTVRSFYEKFTNVPFTGKVEGEQQGKLKDGKKVK